jgi:hypothetical protein
MQEVLRDALWWTRIHAKEDQDSFCICGLWILLAAQSRPSELRRRTVEKPTRLLARLPLQSGMGRLEYGRGSDGITWEGP